MSIRNRAMKEMLAKGEVDRLPLCVRAWRFFVCLFRGAVA
jgi:hypothetical protein